MTDHDAASRSRRARRRPELVHLRARGIGVDRGGVKVLDGVDVAVRAGGVVGLVGPNGVGKTTLLNVLAGVIAPERGAVERHPPSAGVGLLPQEPPRDAELVADFIARRAGITAATDALERATTALAASEGGAAEAYDGALRSWLALGAADFDARVGETWAELGLPPRLLAQPTSSLSGGEAARVGLAALLASRYDVYLLDEPTNDLDVDGLTRLERWVTETRAGIVLVSHDRAFLAACVTDVIAIDEFSRSSRLFAGGWQAYLEERAVTERHAWERFEEYDTKRQSLAQRAQAEREWAQQGRAALRRSDERDKNIRHFRLNQTEQLAGKAARTERAIERLDVVDKPRVAWELRFVIGTAPRSGTIAVRLTAATTHTGAFTLGPIDLLIKAGERVAIVGANGSGKSTLLRVILGRQAPASGTAELAPSAVVGEIEQVRRQLAGDSLLRAFQDAVGLDASDARTMLAKFGLVADHVARRTASLSPGERTRAALAVLMARGVNTVVLDEPTNHLDLPAIEALEQGLDAFPGTLLLVTHDRALLQAVRLTRTIELAGGRIVADTPTGNPIGNPVGD